MTAFTWRRTLVDLKKLHVQFVIDDSGNKTGVILPIGEFEEIIEDMEDLAILAERRDESTLSHEQVLSRLQQDGLV
jgi:hypothetical protein